MQKATRQRIRYLHTPDGVKLAWAEAGTGPVLVKAANWLTHLEYEWESPVWRHWMQFFSEHFRFIRYDERGCGMTDWNAGNLSIDTWVRDLESVVDAAGVQQPFTLLGISQGAAVCIAYAVQHPERVSRLILFGGYARGAFRRNSAEVERVYRAMIDLARFGWGKDNPVFREVFTTRFVPKPTDEQRNWFNELCRKTSTGDIVAELLKARALVDVEDLLPRVKTPTLVVHSRDDNAIAISEGQILAAGIPGAQFVELDSTNHILLEKEDAWRRFCDAVLEFAGVEHAASAGKPDPFLSLSPREREILTLITHGLGNGEIAENLSISEKTVRNHVSNLFDKLGVWTRAQAIVFAHERGFRD
jgi:pimeloyl-ACP methyl ester carboxylesterase/DNA-binding CsgD family transcriptional regulator